MIGSNSLFQGFETWLPLLTIVLAFVSLGLHRAWKTPHPMTLEETLANLGTFLVWRFVFFAGGLALQFWIFSKIADLVPWKLPSGSWVLPASVLVADFLYYWKHRYEHELRVLWVQHSVHHSSEEFNLSTSLRLPWAGSYMNWIFFIPALLLGLSAEQVLLGHQLVLAYQYLVHTEFVGRLGPLELVLNTPSHHRVHHGRNEEYLDRNYGGILIVWDRLFGTFTPEIAPVEYGTVHPVNSKNPWLINAQPWKELFAELARAPSKGLRLKLLLTRPGS